MGGGAVLFFVLCLLAVFVISVWAVRFFLFSSRVCLPFVRAVIRLVFVHRIVEAARGAGRRAVLCFCFVLVLSFVCLFLVSGMWAVLFFIVFSCSCPICVSIRKSSCPFVLLGGAIVFVAYFSRRSPSCI